MKKSKLFSVITGLVPVFLVWGAFSLTAQNVKPGAVAAAIPEQPPFCDEAIPKAKQQLQTEADAKCRTAQACVECLVRPSGIKVYASLIVQPESGSCKKLDAVKTATPEGARAQAFNFEIAQSVCTKSGVTLEVILPDARIRDADLSYEWNIDGKPAGRDIKIDCACGKFASVIVTQHSTKQSVVKTMTLPEACVRDVKSNE